MRTTCTMAVAMTALALSACGGDGSPDLPDPQIEEVACAPGAGDSTQNPDGSASWTPSHTLGDAVYGSLVTRRNAAGEDVTVDYMVHRPSFGIPGGVVVLIAGGSLNAAIQGTVGNVPTQSGGNFLVRSAHRFAEAGYLAITIDRPSDYLDYFDGINSSSLDPYRNSMRHAVDIARVVEHERDPLTDVLILVGTSRGAVSAYANQTLAIGAALSSPLTSGNLVPIGSAALPWSLALRDMHVMWHRDDGCSVTTPADSEELFRELLFRDVATTGTRITGGFRDTVADNPCQAFDYHGFAGIESCAVAEHVAWIDELATRVGIGGGNFNPVALGANGPAGVVAGGVATVFVPAAYDPDIEPLTLGLPYASSTLGGTLALQGTSIIYTPPASVAAETTDYFVFTVADGRGGVDFSVRSVAVSPANP